MKNHDTLVSIIVPVYGTEAYLPTCIESIRNQTHTNTQIILVDDQSPDRCPEICDYYAQKDPRICVIHQKNTGVSGARNTGLHHADGEYTMFVDSDDELYPDAVEVLLQDASRYNADIVSANIKTVFPQGHVSSVGEGGEYILFRDEETILLSLKGDQSTTSACAKLYKSMFIKDIYFDVGKDVNEDGFFLFQCYIRKPLLVQHNILVYQCNVRHQSNSRQPFSDHYLSMLHFCDRKKKLVASHYPQFTDQVHNMEVRTNLQLLNVLCSTTEEKYEPLQRQCVNTVRRLAKYHKPINEYHRLLTWIVVLGLYPLYKWIVRLKYYR
jgi:glycosyltransferase involved in cell wall biosynthesis